MISRLVVSNFRSLGDDVQLTLGQQMTVLVGPNGSGKSNVADVFRFVAEALRVGLEAAISKRHGIAAVRRWSAGHPFDLSIRLEIQQEASIGFYEFILGGDRAEEYRVKRETAEFGPLLGTRARFDIIDGKWQEGPEGVHPQIDRLALALPLVAADDRFKPLADTLRNVSIYSIFPDTLREPQKPDPARPMNDHGANWCSVLKEMKKSERANDLKSALGQVTGDITDFRVEQVGGYLVTEFHHHQERGESKKAKPSKWFDAAQESDGTLRVAGIITALFQSPSLTLLGIEEPELTIHPGAIPLLYQHIQEAAVSSQVLLTTHSPELLSQVDAEDVRVVERRHGVTSVARMAASQRDAVRQRLLTLGELIRMEPLRQEEPGQDTQGV